MRYNHIAVTGGSGLLGGHVVRQLAPQARVKVIDVTPPSVQGETFEKVSVTDHDALKAAFQGVDAVVHLAAIPNPRTSPPDVCFHVNTMGTWAVLQAAEDAGVKRVVVCSSDSTAGLHYNPPGWKPQYLPVDENHPTRPTEPYSLSKSVAETIAKSFADRGRMEVLVIRPGHIIFEREYHEILQRGADVDNYHLWGYVVPEDAAQGFVKALEVDDGTFDIFHIHAADGMNEVPTLEFFTRRYGYVPELRDSELYKSNPTAGVFGISRARTKLGYEPNYTWRDLRQRHEAALQARDKT
jgi:UDP-glucose 4-epimerase